MACSRCQHKLLRTEVRYFSLFHARDICTVAPSSLFKKALDDPVFLSQKYIDVEMIFESKGELSELYMSVNYGLNGKTKTVQFTLVLGSTVQCTKDCKFSEQDAVR